MTFPSAVFPFTPGSQSVIVNLTFVGKTSQTNFHSNC